LANYLLIYFSKYKIRGILEIYHKMKIKILLLLAVFKINIGNAQQSQTFGKGNIKGVTVSASSNSLNGINTLKSTGLLPNPKASSRFLSQATFGPKWQDIQSVNDNGIESWLNTQVNMPPSFSVKSYLSGLHQYMVDSLNARNPSGNYTLQNVFVGNTHFDISWFQGAMVSADQLRWRLGFALSQIFVTSRISAFDDNPYALSSYYDLINNNSLTNYRTLIDSITYHPAMGVYLTYMNNHATDTTGTKKVFPDENYAREIMQLFSIGLYELNDDGTEKKDAQGNSIPTYNNNDIYNLAKVFTGLSWGDSRYLGDRSKNNWSYTLKMKFFGKDSSDKYIRHWADPNTWRIVDGHEPGPKHFLNATIPARPVLQGNQDIQDALNIIFNHPNVPPFMAIRLIRQLVTSNPSPQYVKRVSEAFKNNGSGVRGDMKAVIKAVLLDPEARDCCAEKQDNAYGHLREPLLRYMNLVKGLNLTSTTGIYRNVMVDIYNKLEQRALNSPSVFNFYSPFYVPDGPLAQNGKVAPEFQTLNSLSFANYANGLHRWIISNDPIEYWNIFSGETTKTAQDPTFNLSGDYYLAADKRLQEFVDKYNLILAQGRVSKPNTSIIVNTLKNMPISFDAAGNPNADLAHRRLTMGLFLIMLSPDYLINR